MCEREPRESVPASAVKNGRTISVAATDGEELLRDAGAVVAMVIRDRGAVCSLPSRKFRGRSGGERGRTEEGGGGRRRASAYIRGART